MSSKTFVISKMLSKDLALRESAARLFNRIDAVKETQVIVDFSGIKSITRSFAHEYCRRKKESAKTISETHVPIDVKRMMMAAADVSGSRSKSLELDSVPVVVL